jgi:hypothetical protein
MRWPWVSRELLDTFLASRGEEMRVVNRLQNQIELGHARYDLLLDKYHALKLQGATVTAPRPTVEPREPDAVQYAINEKAGSNHALRFHLTGYAAGERAKRVEDGVIIDAITNWRSEGDDD